MIRFKCPHCGKALKVGDTGAGKKGKCPGCGERVQVPQATALTDDDILAMPGDGPATERPKEEPRVEIPQRQTPPPIAVSEPAVIPSLMATQRSQQPQPLIGVTDAVCPYCDYHLEKMPGRKKKCPACGNAIFVRTRPQDKVRILVRGDQLFPIEEQWSIVRGTHQQFLAAHRHRQTIAKRYETIHLRAEDQLNPMSQELTRELTDGLSQGVSPREVARNITKHVEGFGGREGKERALTIARTETLRALNEGALDRMESLGVEEIGVMVEWSTAGFDVCPLCRPLEGIVLTIQEARGMIPRHESCRCSWTPANVGEDKSGQKRSQTSIQKAIDKSIKAETPEGRERTLAEQKELSSWAGAHAQIAKKRPKGIV